MNQADAITKLKAQTDTLKTMGATSLYLFGSTARNAARPTSDLDVFIDYDREGRFNAFDLVSIKLFLEKELSLPVDITTRDGLHPMLKPDIEQAAIRVF
jgi:uncharacterized protein